MTFPITLVRRLGFTVVGVGTFGVGALLTVGSAAADPVPVPCAPPGVISILPPCGPPADLPSGDGPIVSLPPITVPDVPPVVSLPPITVPDVPPGVTLPPVTIPDDVVPDNPPLEQPPVEQPPVENPPSQQPEPPGQTGLLLPAVAISEAIVECDGSVRVVYETGADSALSADAEHVVSVSPLRVPDMAMTQRLLQQPLSGQFAVEIAAPVDDFRVFVLVDFEPGNPDGVLLADEATATAPTDCPPG
jgi:hypothetical protein